MTCGGSASARTCLVALMPSVPGMRMSMSTTSGKLPAPPGRRRPVVGLAHHVHVVGRGQDHPQPGSYQRVVVDEQHPHAHASLASTTELVVVWAAGERAAGQGHPLLQAEQPAAGAGQRHGGSPTGSLLRTATCSPEPGAPLTSPRWPCPARASRVRQRLLDDPVGVAAERVWRVGTVRQGHPQVDLHTVRWVSWTSRAMSRSRGCGCAGASSPSSRRTPITPRSSSSARCAVERSSAAVSRT